ncbi:MAG: Holliday junction branch migration protein RuvA [Candidatus Pacebacteria bacterium]|nr:Holliday junction branch migration protein RuvA [Candidatus Paceibacterota bacterium]MCF7857660.1 Holliday junction branch migration protein RuvA [Candidatus Paceibacterota bacterium]
MIAKLTGEVIDVRVSQIVVNVHDVGYLVSVSSGTGYELGETVSIHTYLAVRENALDLYGFKVRDELTMFEHLIKLPKIGPKTAMQILSQTTLETLRKSVRSNDPVYLSKMSGIGKKSAEKIVMGLKDILDETDLTGHEAAPNQVDADVIDALISLGYSQRDALQAVQKIPSDVVDTNARIKHALKYVAE